MSECLDALEKLREDCGVNDCESCTILNGKDFCNQRRKYLDIIEKELIDGEKNNKALEIIKETWRITFDDEELTVGIDNVYFLTFKNKEKYDLLKEVLL